MALQLASHLGHTDGRSLCADAGGDCGGGAFDAGPGHSRSSPWRLGADAQARSLRSARCRSQASSDAERCHGSIDLFVDQAGVRLPNGQASKQRSCRMYGYLMSGRVLSRCWDRQEQETTRLDALRAGSRREKHRRRVRNREVQEPGIRNCMSWSADQIGARPECWDHYVRLAHSGDCYKPIRLERSGRKGGRGRGGEDFLEETVPERGQREAR